MCLVLAVASSSLAVNLKDDISCPATITMVLVILEEEIGHTGKTQPDDDTAKYVLEQSSKRVEAAHMLTETKEPATG